MTFKTDKKNTFKGIEVETKTYNPVPVVQIVLTMVAIFILLAVLDHFKIIQIVEVPK